MGCPSGRSATSPFGSASGRLRVGLVDGTVTRHRRLTPVATRNQLVAGRTMEAPHVQDLGDMDHVIVLVEPEQVGRFGRWWVHPDEIDGGGRSLRDRLRAESPPDGRPRHAAWVRQQGGKRPSVSHRVHRQPPWTVHVRPAALECMPSWQPRRGCGRNGAAPFGLAVVRAGAFPGEIRGIPADPHQQAGPG